MCRGGDERSGGKERREFRDHLFITGPLQRLSADSLPACAHKMHIQYWGGSDLQ